LGIAGVSGSGCMASTEDKFAGVNSTLAMVPHPWVASPGTPLRALIEQMQQNREGCPTAILPQQWEPDLSFANLYLEARSSCVLAVENERVVGILTQRDLLRCCFQNPRQVMQSLEPGQPGLTLGDVMSQPVIVLKQSEFTTLSVAGNLLQRHHIRHVPIVDDDHRLVGLVTCGTLQYTQLVHQRCWSDHQQRIITDIEQRYANLVDAAPVGIFHTDAQGHPTYVNERWCAITGWSLVEAMDRPWQHLIVPEDLPRAQAELNQSALEQRPFRCEFRVQRQDGALAWVYGQMIPERNPQGTVIGYVGTFTDITRHKQFEDALQKSDHQSRNILSLIPDYLFRIDCQGRYRDIVTYRGSISLVSHGVNPVGQTMGEVLPPQVAARQMTYLQKALATGELGVYEQQVDLGDHVRWEEVRVIKSGADEALFMVRDISNRKHAEFALQALIEGTANVTGQDFFPSLVRHIAGALQVDYALVSELQETELHTLAWWAKGVPQSAYHYKVVGTPCERSITSGIYYCEANAQQYFPTDTDLTSMEVECYLGVTLQNARGVPIGVLCVLHRHPLPNPDHARKLLQVFAARAAAELERQRATLSLQQLNQQLETRVQERTEALQQSNAELARATRMKDEFLANMSHELRTPLNAILGLTEALQEGIFGDLKEAQARTLHTIETSGQHLLALINDILDVAKIEAGKVELHRQGVNVADLCYSSCKFVAQEAIQKNIQIDTQLAPDLPPVMLDERRMRQVLINLLSNAVKFTPDGGKVTITTGCSPIEAEATPCQSGKIHIAVADTGIGIAPEKLSRLFQPFVQIDSALNRRYQGTGLGLALVKRIVELHGGQVSVTSHPGQGSCFTLALPWTPCVEAKELIRSGEGLQPSSLSVEPTIPARILIAEDHEANIATLSEYLKARKYSVLQAHNGQEAIDQTLAHKPDLILMDIQMPGVDGLEAIQTIRENPSTARIPIIAITAPTQPRNRQQSMAAGADRYLIKPLKLKQLAITIQELLSASSARLDSVPEGREALDITDFA
jgi:PAS domain S-box-containing protein